MYVHEVHPGCYIINPHVERTMTSAIWRWERAFRKDGRKQVQCKCSSHRDPCMQISVSLECSNARIQQIKLALEMPSFSMAACARGFERQLVVGKGPQVPDLGCAVS